MYQSSKGQIRKIVLTLVQPFIWFHEYCHYWVARRLGLLARIQGAKTYVHRVNLRQHVLIAIAPSIPSFILTILFATTYMTLADTTTAKVNMGSFTLIAALMLLSCAGDWISIVRALIDPSILAVDSTAILIICTAPAHEQREIRSQIEKLGYFVEWAQSDYDAKNCLQENPFDLIIVDAKIPSSDQRAFRQRLNTIQRNSAIQVFNLKSHDELHMIPQYLEMGYPQPES